MTPRFRYCWLPAITGLLLACSERPSKPETVTTEEGTKHPWDLIPDDPELLAGRVTYLAECSLCHNEGEEGSPALSDRSQWETRKSQGIDTLFKHAIEGFIGEDGEMPARGGTDYLTDNEVRQAVRYMLATQNPT